MSKPEFTRAFDRVLKPMHRLTGELLLAFGDLSQLPNSVLLRRERVLPSQDACGAFPDALVTRLKSLVPLASSGGFGRLGCLIYLKRGRLVELDFHVALFRSEGLQPVLTRFDLGGRLFEVTCCLL